MYSSNGIKVLDKTENSWWVVICLLWDPNTNKDR